MKQSVAEVEVFSDYICPFCYIGYLRLEKLRHEIPLDVHWRFMEIHPDNPEQGRPLSELGYPPEHWAMLMRNLSRMAQEEGVVLAERTFTTNSRRALKLAYAVIDQQPDRFELLNRKLYEWYFVERINIGDPQRLNDLALGVEIQPEVIARAWRDERYDKLLTDNLISARARGIHGTPAFVFDGQVYSGAIPLTMMKQAASSGNA